MPLGASRNYSAFRANQGVLLADAGEIDRCDLDTRNLTIAGLFLKRFAKQNLLDRRQVALHERHAIAH